MIARALAKTVEFRCFVSLQILKGRGRSGRLPRLLIVVLAGLALVSCGPAAGTAVPTADLPVLWPAPSFQLTDQDGQPAEASALAGKVWLANFIFTNCPDVCPTDLIPKMQQVQKAVLADPELKDQVRLISISVDPARDTPEVLHRYAEVVGAEPTLWRFLVGTPDETVDLMQQGFKVGVALREIPLATAESGHSHSSDGYTVNHTTRFVLVDRDGNVRATPLSSDASAEQLVAGLRQLVDEP